MEATTVKEVLHAAANLITTHGHEKGAMTDPETGHICLNEALARAVGGTCSGSSMQKQFGLGPYWDQLPHEPQQLLKNARIAVLKQFGIDEGNRDRYFLMGRLCTINNSDKTATDIVNGVRAAAEVA